jgi:hypothetical protein
MQRARGCESLQAPCVLRHIAHHTDPANGTPLKVWDCYPGTMQQTFRYHDGVIELEGKSEFMTVVEIN